MPEKKRYGLSYANVVSTLALFVALGGTAVAAGLIDGKKIKPKSITGKQIKSKSVPGSDLKPDSVRGRQVLESSLRKVPRSARADRSVSADTSAVADLALALGPAATANLRDRCPTGTTAYAGVCIETEPRSPMNWPAAARACGDSGGRLAGLEELEGFRQQPGITLSGTEHTSAYLDLNGLSGGGEMTVGITDGGTLAPGFDYGASSAPFRCVFPATNR